jgi:exonuclease SbcD
VGGRARYAGSPVAFSFSEARHRKSVALVDLDTGEAELAEVPVTRPLAVLRGSLETLLADPALAVHERAWVQATLTDPARPADAMERLRRRFPHAVLLAFEPEGVAAAADASYAERLRGLDDLELLGSFVRDVRGTDASGEELALLRDALTAGRVAEVAG